ncbi:hypothetical protein FA13DRAFT_1776806 [Coprinellus micaceus]|uniref:Uncharacterized protein n=1 Tax=Coprinellus micaceus TaxID=71717 RepID=A0A4Y7SY12_COPMI|nr:hypothetical protein FA13DRAFT_1776806 [Coprinellus micaceus]
MPGGRTSTDVRPRAVSCGRLERRKLEANYADIATEATCKSEKASSLKRKPSAALKRGSKERAVEDPKSDNNGPKGLSEVRKSHITDPFNISIRSIEDLNPEDFESIVSTIVRQTKEGRKRGQYSKDIVHVLDRKNFDAMWEAAVVGFGLRRRFAVSVEAYGTKPEAWARRIIDCFVDILLEGDPISHSVCHLEMDLASKQQPKGEAKILRNLAKRRPVADGVVELPAQNPGRIEKGDVLLEVTGSIDYMLMTLPPAYQYMFSNVLEEAASLDRATALLHPSIAKRVNLLPIEAKRMDPEEDITSKNLPQVLAQVHLSMTKTGRQVMPWVLSSGDVWVFGISHAKGDDWDTVHFKSRPLFDGLLGASQTEKRPHSPSGIVADDCRASTGGNVNANHKQLTTDAGFPDSRRRVLGPEQLDVIVNRAKTIMRILTVWWWRPNAIGGDPQNPRSPRSRWGACNRFHKASLHPTVRGMGWGGVDGNP